MRKLLRSGVFLLFLIPNLSSLGATKEQCLKCHANQTYSVYNEWTERNEKRLMNPYFVIDSVRMQHGVHKKFSCTDCHSADYENYPHDGALKMEPMSTCIDCHGGDDNYAAYQFEKIEEEFGKSVHAQVHGEVFTCSKCHSQHYYQPVARNSSSIKEIVDHSNAMCLVCHDNMQRYQLVSDKNKPELIEVHRWLPNQKLHFQNVRCIECHTEVVDSLMVSHNVRPKGEAVKNCIECHTADSRLKASLYKYQNLQAREDGIGNILANESYVIGAYQNPLLNGLSVLIFLMVLAGIGVHIVFRILKK